MMGLPKGLWSIVSSFGSDFRLIFTRTVDPVNGKMVSICPVLQQSDRFIH
jgi:hypothetical protein